MKQLQTIRAFIDAAYTTGWPRLEDAKAAGEALSELERLAGPEPILIVQHGEICYKSQDDDQSYGMWCPVTPDAEHGLRNGTQLYTTPPAQQPQAQAVATVIEDLEHDGQGWCAKVRWLFNPVPVGEMLLWRHQK